MNYVAIYPIGRDVSQALFPLDLLVELDPEGNPGTASELTSM